jgi:hypothetical protein
MSNNRIAECGKLAHRSRSVISRMRGIQFALQLGQRFFCFGSFSVRFVDAKPQAAQLVNSPNFPVILTGALRLEESGFYLPALSMREDNASQILRSPRLSQDDNLLCCAVAVICALRFFVPMSQCPIVPWSSCPNKYRGRPRFSSFRSVRRSC